MKTLRFGSQGPQVELLQLALLRAGYTPGAVDGIFGQNTLVALRRFQQNSGLTPDGIAGARTWRALDPYLTGSVTYRLRSGDTLYKLAREYGSSISAIETANPGLDPLNLTVGANITIPLNFPLVPTSITFTYTVLDYCVRGLKLRYPFITTGSAGKSVMGKELYYLTLGYGENQVFYNGAHHGNEWLTTLLLMKYIENLCSAYVRGGETGGISADEIFESSTLFFIPMVNPDGVDLAAGELTGGSYFEQARRYALNYPAIPFPTGWKANINGVDLNLQYPAGWENAREIKFAQGYTSPGPRDYVGTGPLTQPESRAVYNFTRNRDFSITLSYHTQGQVIFWRYLDFQPENSYEIAREFSRVSGYSVETTPSESGYAGYKDWFILTYDLPGYTVEAGLGQNPLPISQFDKIYADNVGMLSLAAVITA